MPELALNADHVSKSFGKNRLLDDVSLALAPGETAAIIGESGSGKSTLLNIIAGLAEPDAGTVSIAGATITGMAERPAAHLRRDRIGFVFQSFLLLPYLTAQANVELPLSLIGVPPDERAKRAAAMLNALGVASRSAAMPRELSGGEMQRVAIARALVHKPALVLADEPTGNLDAGNAQRVLDLMFAAVAQSNAACVLVTHSASAAARAHKTYRLVGGKLQLD
jgi:putative ABC transport system ATP-binding protein